MALFLLMIERKAIYLSHDRRITMAEFIVAVDHITYYIVRAEDEITAIDLVLEGEGEEIASETHDAYITEYQVSDSHAG
jgi:hypothetical protein